MSTFALHDNIYKVFNEKETYYATEFYLNLCGFDLKIAPDAQIGTLEYYGEHYTVVRADNEKYGWYNDDHEVRTLRCCYDQIFYENSQMLLCPPIYELESLGIKIEDECNDGRYYEDDDEENGDHRDIYQTFFIDGETADFLKERTHEMVFYSPDLDMYLLGVSHFGTAWRSCETEIKF